ncbi:MAG: ABC transporter permease [Thermoleophilia bacterium]|nr:ABC transporter permease [Thermoleophilia bacterium]
MNHLASESTGRTAPSGRGARAPGWTRARLRLRPGAVATALAVFLGLTLAAEVMVRLTQVASFILPPPSAVVRELAEAPALFARHAAVTIYEAGTGLVLAAAAALLFAAAAVHSRSLDRVLTPLVVVSQTIPVIALAPLLVLWFGYGALPRVVICALIAFFPMAVTALEGFRSADPQLLMLLRSVDASRWDVFWRVRVPGAAPFLAAGFRTGVTLSLVGAVVAEWTGTDRGLGYLVLSANSRLATAQAFGAVLLITLLGLAAYGGAIALEHKICWWNRPAPAGRREKKEKGWQ